MQTECSADLFGFAPVEGRAVVAGVDGGKITSDAGALLLGATGRAGPLGGRVVAGFDGGKITSDAGALLLGATDRAIRLVERFTACFTDSRSAELIEHEV